MMGERQVRQEALFYGFSLEEHVPADHLLRSNLRAETAREFKRLHLVLRHMRALEAAWRPGAGGPSPNGATRAQDRDRGPGPQAGDRAVALRRERRRARRGGAERPVRADEGLPPPAGSRRWRVETARRQGAPSTEL